MREDHVAVVLELDGHLHQSVAVGDEVGQGDVLPNPALGHAEDVGDAPDATDPLSVAMKDLPAQPLDIWICVASLAENPGTTAFDNRPSHHEIALV